MRPHRLSIAGSLGIVCLVAFGLAGLRAANELAASVSYSIAIFATVTSAMGGIFSVGGLRTFCVGFASFCGVYLLLAFGPFAEPANTPASPIDAATVNGAPMLTRLLLEALDTIKPGEAPPVVGSDVDVLWNGTYWPSTMIGAANGRFEIHYKNFGSNADEWIGPERIGRSAYRRAYSHQVGHSLSALLLGLIGGLIADLFRRTRPRPEPSP